MIRRTAGITGPIDSHAWSARTCRGATPIDIRPGRTRRDHESGVGNPPFPQRSVVTKEKKA